MFTHPNYFRTILKNKKTIFATTFIVLVLGIILSLIQPFEYSANVKFLVIQKSTVAYDAYSAAKSAEKIGKNLAQVIYSNSFFNKVLNAGFGIDEKYFADEENKKRKQWQQMIDADVVGETSVLTMTVYHKDKDQALKIAQAVTYVLSTQSAEYVGIGDIDLKMIESPLASRYVERPNFILNALVSIIVGLFVGIGYVVVKTQ